MLIYVFMRNCCVILFFDVITCSYITDFANVFKLPRLDIRHIRGHPPLGRLGLGDVGLCGATCLFFCLLHVAYNVRHSGCNRPCIL